MKYISLFENFKKVGETLFIIDVQKSFSKFFTDNYLRELKKYCNHFEEVYQIYDNHVEGKDVDTDYLYDIEPDGPKVDDIYSFPNQVNVIEKRYNYDVNVDFYKKILSDKVYKLMKEKEKKNEFKRGDFFKTKKGTILVYIGNNHVWYHCPKKLYSILKKYKGSEITMVGGADQECFLDVETTAKSLDVIVKRDFRFIYSAKHCPIK